MIAKTVKKVRIGAEVDFLLEAQIGEIVQKALEEDIGSGDVTTASVIPSNAKARGRFLAKGKGIIAGWDVVKRVFAKIDPDVGIDIFVNDGREARSGEFLGNVIGMARALHTGERVALNFLQRMSGIATMTKKFVDAVGDTRARILDTRKTMPGLRVLDKRAVVIGGGHNHRNGLFDMVLIKKNHVAMIGSIREAVRLVRRQHAHRFSVEIEVKTIEEFREALSVDADRILLDNMKLDEMREAAATNGGRIPLEASGNVTLENVAEIASTGVDFISVGQLTHSVPALDISFVIDSHEE
ncbi:MAG: carboxylating nicotinate-nucleotide diphosphorylase [Ignavibacteriales bacterium]|nr:carboxylating nicotinate-nucleotide diphosphorylase [Ignavibacteriales bacterium]